MTDLRTELRFAPSIPPDDATQLSRYLMEEFTRLSAIIENISLGHLEKTYVAPDRPRVGDMRYADGTEWNPGSGAGIYYYNGSAWVQL